jgi:amidohydrolase
VSRRDIGKRELIIESVTLDNLIEGAKGNVVGWRLHLHRNPEISSSWKEISQFYEMLEPFGGLKLHPPRE